MVKSGLFVAALLGALVMTPLCAKANANGRSVTITSASGTAYANGTSTISASGTVAGTGGDSLLHVYVVLGGADLSYPSNYQPAIQLLTEPPDPPLWNFDTKGTTSNAAKGDLVFVGATADGTDFRGANWSTSVPPSEWKTIEIK